MNCSSIITIEYQNPSELFKLLISEEYNFNENIKILLNETEKGVEINVQSPTPQLLKIGITAVLNSCDIIYKTHQTIKNG